jgi:hypothetical protein
MKTRITAVLALLVVALSLAAAASAAPRQSPVTHPQWPIIGFFSLKPSDANRPATLKRGEVRTWRLKVWKVKPLASAGWT